MTQPLFILCCLIALAAGAALAQPDIVPCSATGNPAGCYLRIDPSQSAAAVAFDPHGHARALLVDSDGYVLAHCSR